MAKRTCMVTRLAQCLRLKLPPSLVIKVKKLALYEAPYNDDPIAQNNWKEYIKSLTELLAVNRCGDAVALFMRSAGMPPEQVEDMRHALFWPAMEDVAPTLVYDHTAIMGETTAVPTKLVAEVTVPRLVMNGAASFPFMHQTAESLSKALPHAERRTSYARWSNARS
jgi:hypothetical protein